MSARLPKAIADSAAQAAEIEKQLADPQPVDSAEEQGSQPAATPSQTDAAKPTADPLLEQRYKSLQGTYNATVRKAQEQAEQIAQLKQKLEQSQSVAVDPSILERTLHSLQEGLGEELAKTIDARIEAAVARAIAVHVNPLREAMTSTVDREEERLTDAFYDRLEMLVPNWEDINDNPAFKEWLSQRDPASGATLLALLKDAERRLDADRAALFFRTFERDVAAPQPAPAPRPSTVSAPHPSPRTPRLIKVAEIDKFYSDLRRGVYRGREAEADAFEREIANAQREGRVVP